MAMIFDYIVLLARERSELDTEMRFALAGAMVDGCELIAFAFETGDDEEQNKRTATVIKRILSVLKREGRAAFYIDDDSLTRGSTEAEFLKNKYPTYLASKNAGHSVIYVKL